MRLWTVFLVAWVVAVGLDAAPPLARWGREWGAAPHPWRIAFFIVAAVAFALRPVLRQALRRYGQEPMEVLPLTAQQRFRIDGVAIALFMAPPLMVLIFVAKAGGVTLPAMTAIIAGLAVQTATLGRPQSVELATRTRGPAIRLPRDLPWLLRGGPFAGAELLAIACAGGARLAIANNGVTNPIAATRIEGFFGAIAATILATAIARARHGARHYRAIELALPIASGRRLLRFSLTALPFAAPLLLARQAAPVSFVLYLALILLGEHRSLRGRTGDGDVIGAGAAAAILSAIDVRLALLAVVILLPLSWHLALRSDESCDAPVVQSEGQP
jgi:hypothetical protein